MMKLPLLLCAALLACLAASPAHASQELACVMRFHVVDANTKAPVAASITVSDSRSGWVRNKTANTKGRSTFHGIRPDDPDRRGKGNQDVTVAAPGYEPQRFEDVACPHGRTVAARVKLELLP